MKHKTLSSSSLGVSSNREKKGTAAPDVGGELNLIRAPEKPVSTVFRGRRGAPS